MSAERTGKWNVGFKHLIAGSSLSVNQVSMQLGFEYPQPFVRFFKAHTGMTPTQYRAA